MQNMQKMQNMPNVQNFINHEVQSPMSPFNLEDLFSPRIWSSFFLAKHLCCYSYHHEQKVKLVTIGLQVAEYRLEERNRDVHFWKKELEEEAEAMKVSNISRLQICIFIFIYIFTFICFYISLFLFFAFVFVFVFLFALGRSLGNEGVNYFQILNQIDGRLVSQSHNLAPW